MIKYWYIFLWMCFSSSAFATLKENMLPAEEKKLWMDWEGMDATNKLFEFVRDFLFNILWIVAVGVFIYFWFRLITAKWSPEDLKKTMLWLVYAIVWLAIIPLAWGIVKLIASLDL